MSAHCPLPDARRPGCKALGRGLWTVWEDKAEREGGRERSGSESQAAQLGAGRASQDLDGSVSVK